MTDTATNLDQHVKGPWVAVLADRDGFVYPTYEMAAKDLDEGEEMTISVVRDTALPVDDGDGGEMQSAGTYNAGDVIFEIDAYLIDDDDPSLGAEVRYAQAQAMADGLNHATGLAPATTAILDEIAAERARQDTKWGEQNHPDGTGPAVVWSYTGPAAYVAESARSECQRLFGEGYGTWRDILTEEVAEAYATTDEAELRAELVQVAAVAVAWVEAIDRRGGEDR